MFNIWKSMIYKKKKKLRPITCTIINHYDNDPLNIKSMYNVIRTIDQSFNRGTYVVKIDNKKYFLKIKSNNDSEYIIYCKLYNISHCNLIEYISATPINGNYHYIYKYYESDNLTQYLLNQKIDIYNIFTQIVHGIDFLHTNNIIHCDLKPDNILVCHDNTVKIVDLDLARECDTEDGIIESEMVGTLNYIAPESYDLNIYSKKSDMWSLGVILYIMLTNKFPHNIELSVVNSKSNLYRYNEFKHIDIDNINFQYKDKTLIKIVKNLLSFVDKDRMSSSELLKILKSEIHLIDKDKLNK